MSRRVRGPDLALLRDTMGKIPRAWCPSCRAELRPGEVLTGRCPKCGVPLEHVIVDERTAREIGVR